MCLELWMILTTFAVLVAAITTVVIARRLSRIVILLEQLNTALSPLRIKSSVISTVIRSQEEAIQASRQAAERRVEQLLLAEE